MILKCKSKSEPYVLNTHSEENKTVFYAYLACFMITLPLNVYEFLSNAGFIRRNTLSVLVWMPPRNT